MDDLTPNRTKEFIHNIICHNLPKDTQFDPDLYESYDVKRGLRNADGTGVMAGFTMIGNVQGYVVVDGERQPEPGRLFYRGYDVMNLISGFTKEHRFGFEEVAYLLLFGRLPNKEQYDLFRGIIGEYMFLPANFTEDMILKAPSNNIMNKLARSVLALYSYDDEPESVDIENMIRQSIELVARFPTIVAHAYAVKRHYYDNDSLYLHRPQEGLSIAQNFLYAVRQDKKFTNEEARLLDICLVLHAEHGGGNNSAFATRVLSSSGTDTYSAIAAAVGSLKGPKHGGANTQVMNMFAEIKENVRDWKDDDEVTAYLTKILNKQAGDGSGLIYGMGHAIYTESDPRAVVLKKNAKNLAKKTGMLDEFELMESIERLSPGVFLKVKNDSKVICANVDMYSGLVYQMLNIPQDLYTPLFAIARITGWCAHRIEEAMTGGRIIRPAYKSLVPSRQYVALADRK